MSDTPEVTVTLTFPHVIAARLAALDYPDGHHHTLAGKVASVLEALADHAQQGVSRPGAWERRWVAQAFGDSWAAIPPVEATDGE